jgi:hypothetical protein
MNFGAARSGDVSPQSKERGRPRPLQRASVAAAKLVFKKMIGWHSWKKNVALIGLDSP